MGLNEDRDETDRLMYGNKIGRRASELLRNSPHRLPIVRMDGKEYFIDSRLSELRNVKDPSDVERESPDVISFLASKCKKEGRECVVDLDNDKDRVWG